MQSVKSRVAADFIDLKRPARAAFIVQNANFKCNAVNRQTHEGWVFQAIFVAKNKNNRFWSQKSTVLGSISGPDSKKF